MNDSILTTLDRYKADKEINYDMLLIKIYRNEEIYMEIGKKVWIIPDGFLPVHSNGDFVSHEAVCVLNITEKTV